MSPHERQISLFEDPPLHEDLEPSVVELARSVPAHVHFGTCSWTFPGWAGLVYQRDYRSQKKFVAQSLREYVRYPLFRTVEIDRSYYAPLDATALAAYGELLPESFECGMKVWQEISMLRFPRHPRYGDRAGMVNPSFLDARLFEERVVSPIEEAFSTHIGPLIISIPPSGRSTSREEFEERLSHFLARVPSGYRYAFEIRDRHLFTPRYLAILREYGAAHVINFWADMPGISVQVEQGALTASFTVARLMLPPKESYARLKDEWAPFDRIVASNSQMRSEVAALIQATAKAQISSYIYVNNKAEGCAPLTIRAIAEALQ